MSRCGLARSVITVVVVVVVVGGVGPGCDLTPDPNKHAQVAATGSNAVGPKDAGPPPDAGSQSGPPKADAAPKRPVDAKLEGRVLARCVAQNRWAGHAFFHMQDTPFSVLVGTPNRWTWVNRSSPSESFPQQVEVPLDALVRATGVAGLTPSVQVLVVSGTATDQDTLAEIDDDQLNRLIYQHQHANPGAVETVRLAHDSKREGKPLQFESTAGCIGQPPGSNAADHCTTPQCPK